MAKQGQKASKSGGSKVISRDIQTTKGYAPTQVPRNLSMGGKKSK